MACYVRVLLINTIDNISFSVSNRLAPIWRHLSSPIGNALVPHNIFALSSS